MAFQIVRWPEEEVRVFCNALIDAKVQLTLCEICQNFCSDNKCDICISPRRDHAVICVVSDPRDVAAIERINEFYGVYHVLHGLLSPMDGIGPEQLKVRELVERASKDLNEIILATNPTLEGDTTALYLAKMLKPFNVKVTRLAYGMPVGGELDYADSATLHSALEYRREL